MILFYLFPLALGLTLEKSSLWSFNPNCPTEDAARNCEDVCITANARCIPECDGDQECIRQCSRDYALCVEACPCYSECYGGCPCPNENEYCQSCESRYEKEHNVCRDETSNWICAFEIVLSMRLVMMNVILYSKIMLRWEIITGG